MYQTVETQAMAELNKELMPILAELFTLNPTNKDHPAFQSTFNWLVDPQRTGEEFSYVIGPLHQYVYDAMCENSDAYFNKNSYDNIGMVAAAEAIAIKCPVLEGPWEHAGWILVDNQYVIIVVPDLISSYLGSLR